VADAPVVHLGCRDAHVPAGDAVTTGAVM
jgi:hypothetical protein